MKNFILFVLIFQATFLYGKINIVTSIVPIKTFVKQIVQNKANISVMVKPGSSPHTYEPKPSQMININKANIYFAIGVEFENSWLNKFHNQNKNMHIVNLSDQIQKTKNPHIWVSPNKVKQIAKNILDTMIKYDPNNSKFYTQNYKHFLQQIDQTDNQIKEILKNTPKGSSFMVFHPAWEYFANQYNLKQLAIEIDGKSPKPKELIKIIKTAKKYHIKAIIASKEFSTKTADQIAKTLHIKVIQISPLASNWNDNLITLAKAIGK